MGVRRAILLSGVRALGFALALSATPASAQAIGMSPRALETTGGGSPLSHARGGAGSVSRVDGQVRPAPRPVPRPSTGISFRAYALFDSTTMAASETFDAVFETTKFDMKGGGGEVVNLWKGIFARVAGSSGTLTGSRAVVIDGQVIRLGIPLTVEMRPIEFGAGWRFGPFLGSRIVPYGGAGFLRVSYKERSDFAGPGEDTDETFNGSVVFGGVEARIVSWIIAGAEVQYRRVPDTIGGGGVSREFDETDLGGVTVRVLFGIRR